MDLCRELYLSQDYITIISEAARKRDGAQEGFGDISYRSTDVIALQALKCLICSNLDALSHDSGFFFTYYGILLKTHKTFIFILLAVVMLSARLQFRKHFFINNKNNTLTTNGSGLLSFVTKVTSTLLLSKYLMWHQGYLRYVLMGIMLFALLGFTKQINISNSHVCFSTSTNSTYKQSISSWNRLMLRIIMLQQTSCRSRIHGDVVLLSSTSIIAKEFMHNCCQYRR